MPDRRYYQRRALTAYYRSKPCSIFPTAQRSCRKQHAFCSQVASWSAATSSLRHLMMRLYRAALMIYAVTVMQKPETQPGPIDGSIAQ